jgi:DNA-binding MarR family transcriptional regulator
MYNGALLMSTPQTSRAANRQPKAAWTFLTNHAHVLICLARNPGWRVRDVASTVAITERAVLKILGDLEAAGVLQRQREGRRTRYHISTTAPLRHPVEAHRKVRHLLAMISP